MPFTIMDPPQPPSPLSLGPARKPSAVEVGKLPPIKTEFSPTPTPIAAPNPVFMHARFSASRPTGTPVAQRLRVLSQFLAAPPATGRQDRVIAVDGLDRRNVQAVIAELHYHLADNLQYPVYVLNNDQNTPFSNLAPELAQFHAQIERWAATWREIVHSQPLLSRPCDPGVEASSESTPFLCIWIVALSPYMATVRAANRMTLTGSYHAADLWHSLAGQWHGHSRPDVTINIQEIADTSY